MPGPFNPGGVMVYGAPFSGTPEEWMRRNWPSKEPPTLPSPDGTPIPLDPPEWRWRSDQPPSDVDLILLWTGLIVCIAERGTFTVEGEQLRLADRWRTTFGAGIIWRPEWRWMLLPKPPVQGG